LAKFQSHRRSGYLPFPLADEKSQDAERNPRVFPGARGGPPAALGTEDAQRPNKKVFFFVAARAKRGFFSYLRRFSKSVLRFGRTKSKTAHAFFYPQAAPQSNRKKEAGFFFPRNLTRLHPLEAKSGGGGMRDEKAPFFSKRKPPLQALLIMRSPPSLPSGTPLPLFIQTGAGPTLSTLEERLPSRLFFPYAPRRRPKREGEALGYLLLREILSL